VRYPLAARNAERFGGRISIIRTLLVANWTFLAIAVTLLSAVSSILAPNAWNVITSNTATYNAIEHVGLRINLLLYTLPIVISAIVAYYWPHRWRSMLLIIALLPLPIGAVTSGRIPALLVTLAVLLPTCWVGREITRFFIPDTDRATLWSLGAVIGLILLGMLGFVAGILGILQPVVFWPILLGSTLILLISPARARLIGDLRTIGPTLARPAALTPLRVLMAGLLVATVWTVILGALSPEVNSDTTRARTAAALSFAQSGRLEADDIAGAIASTPALGEITYAIVLTLGPLPTAKLLALAIGGICIALVALVARRLGGRRAELLAVVAFATMPLVVWLGQTAYLDLFTCLAALAAALFFISQQNPTIRATVASGLCCGWGIAVKLHFAYVTVGIAVTLLLLVLGSSGAVVARIRRATILLVTFGVATVGILLAPLIRSMLLTGQIPGLTLATQAFGRADGTSPAALADLTRFGYSRDLLHFIALPLNLTVSSLQFEWVPTPWGPFNGLLGYLPLALLPIIVLVRPKRRATALWVGAFVASVGWFYSAQYLRYGLPIVALLCPLGAAAFEQLRRTRPGPGLRQITTLLILVPLLAGVLVQARVPEYKHDFVLGRESQESYLARFLFCCGGTEVLRLLDAQPDATRALALYQIPRIYMHTPVGTTLVAPDGRPLNDTSDPSATLAALDAGGYSHLIIARRYLATSWDNSQLIDEGFLRRYAVLVGNSSDTFLYRILPPAERMAPVSWTKGPELLTNGGFETASGSEAPDGWTSVHMGAGHSNAVSANAALPQYKRDNQAASGQGAVLVGRDDGWETTVPVQADQRYILDTASRSAATGDSGGFALRLEWRDANGHTLGTSISHVPTSASGYHHFSLAATAPPGTTTATVILLATDTTAWVDDVSLQAAVGGTELEALP
jgi:hypothetical protein